jgi:hypothetical protein
MKLAHITPAPLLDVLSAPRESAHFCIAQEVVRSSYYREWFRIRAAMGHEVILDTDAFETKQLTPISTIVAAANTVQPTHIIVPDDMLSCKRTLDAAQKAVPVLRYLYPRAKLIGVPHGSSWREYLSCADALHELGVDLIGLIEEADEFGMTRAELVTEVADHTGARIYLNGVSETLMELVLPEVRRHIDLCDTAKFVVWGLSGVKVAPPTEGVCWSAPPYPGRETFGGRKGYFHHASVGTPNRVVAVRWNMLAWREYLKEGE